MTVTDTSVILSDSVRHARPVLLFIWKWFNVSELWAVDTSRSSFLCRDSRFAGADTATHECETHCTGHLNSGILLKFSICVTYKNKQHGGLSVSHSGKLHAIILTAGIDPVTIWIANLAQHAFRTWSCSREAALNYDGESHCSWYRSCGGPK